MWITLVCVDRSHDCKSIWQLVNATVNVAHIVFGRLQNGAEQPIENQETAVLWKKAFFFFGNRILYLTLKAISYQ